MIKEEKITVGDMGSDMEVAKDSPSENSENRWEEKENELKLFQPTGDIVRDARDYYGLIGLKYEGSHIGKLLEEKDIDGIVEQLEYTLGVEEKSGFDDIDSYFDVTRQIIKSILDAHKDQKKEKIDVDLISPDEWEKYKQIRLEALKVNPGAFGALYEEEVKKSDAEWKEMVLKFQDPNSKIKMFAAREENKFIGMGGFFWSAPGVARLSELYVSNDARHGGVGSALMKKIIIILEQDARFNQIELIVNGNQIKAIEFYEKVGFVVTKMITDDSYDLQNQYLMIKKLDKPAKEISI